MANPQKENGHVSVANDIWEALCRADIPGRQRRIFDVIVRKTWGWNKKTDSIPLSQLSEMTGIKRPHVCQLLNWLKAANMVIRDATGKTSIQKDYDAWVVPPVGVPPKGLGSPARGTSRRRKSASPAEGNCLVPPKGHSKDTLSKDTLSKDMHPPVNGGEQGNQNLVVLEEKPQRERTPVEQVMDAFHLTVNPTINYGNTTQRRAAEQLVKQIGIDKVLAAIKFIHEVASQDHYAPTITTPFQLREKFGSLVSYAHKKQNKGGGGSINLDNV